MRTKLREGQSPKHSIASNKHISKFNRSKGKLTGSSNGEVLFLISSRANVATSLVSLFLMGDMAVAKCSKHW